MSRPAPARPPAPASRGRNLVPWVVGAAIALAAILGVVAALSGGDDDSDPDSVDATATAPVEITGTALPTLGSVDESEVIGQPAPEVVGTDLAGAPLEITADGRPKALAFIAHWCPHCQREVTDLVSYLNDNALAEGVDVVGISTRVEPGGSNYPPAAWLESEGWPFPTLRDDEESSVATAYGLSVTPLWVFLDAEGNVAQRVSGELGTDGIAERVAALAAGEPLPT